MGRWHEGRDVDRAVEREGNHGHSRPTGSGEAARGGPWRDLTGHGLSGRERVRVLGDQEDGGAIGREFRPSPSS